MSQNVKCTDLVSIEFQLHGVPLGYVVVGKILNRSLMTLHILKIVFCHI